MPNQEELNKRQEILELHVEPQMLQTETMAPPPEAQLLHKPVQKTVEAPLYNQEVNAALLAQAQQRLPAVHAQQVATGTPVQEEASAKQSHKQMRQERRNAAKARAQCPVGDAATYDIVNHLKEMKAQKGAPVVAHGALMTESGVDARVMLCLCHGYKVDKKGKPASQKDAALKQADDKLFDDYCSKDLERRRPHLDRLVEEMTQFSFSTHMFSTHSLRQDVVKSKEFGDRLVYLENMQNDPINKPYFEGLPLATQQILETINHTLYDAYVGALSSNCEKQGVDYNRAQYYNMMDPIEQGRRRRSTGRTSSPRHCHATPRSASAWMPAPPTGSTIARPC